MSWISEMLDIIELCTKNGKNIEVHAGSSDMISDKGSVNTLVASLEKLGFNVKYFNDQSTELPSWRPDILLTFDIDYLWKTHIRSYTTVIDLKNKKLSARSYANEFKSYDSYRFLPDYQLLQTNLLQKYWKDFDSVIDRCYFFYASYEARHTILNYPTQLIVDILLEQFNLGKRYFFFDCHSEDFSEDNIKKIHIVVEVLKKTANEPINCFYMTGCLNGDAAYYEFVKSIYEEPILIPLAARYYEDSSKKFRTLSENTYPIKLRDKNFLCFNRMARPHRLCLVDFFIKHDLLKNNFVSLLGDFLDDGTSSFDGSEFYDEDKYPNIAKNRDIFPLNLNATKERHNPAELEAEDSVYYENSYLSIVTETVFEKVFPSVFASEKVYKPIIMLHPFILVGVPYFLKYLRECGYQTFHPFIDESYDEIVDDRKRMKAICEEILRLSAFTDEDWKEWMENVKHIVEFNKEKWVNADDFAITKNIQHLIDLNSNHDFPQTNSKLRKP